MSGFPPPSKKKGASAHAIRQHGVLEGLTWRGQWRFANRVNQAANPFTYSKCAPEGAPEGTDSPICAHPCYFGYHREVVDARRPFGVARTRDDGKNVPGLHPAFVGRRHTPRRPRVPPDLAVAVGDGGALMPRDDEGSSLQATRAKLSGYWEGHFVMVTRQKTSTKVEEKFELYMGPRLANAPEATKAAPGGVDAVAEHAVDSDTEVAPAATVSSLSSSKKKKKKIAPPLGAGRGRRPGRYGSRAGVGFVPPLAPSGAIQCLVHGHGVNMFGSFSISGTYDHTAQSLHCEKRYDPIRRPRKGSGYALPDAERRASKRKRTTSQKMDVDLGGGFHCRADAGAVGWEGKKEGGKRGRGRGRGGRAAGAGASGAAVPLTATLKSPRKGSSAAGGATWPKYGRSKHRGGGDGWSDGGSSSAGGGGASSSSAAYGSTSGGAAGSLGGGGPSVSFLNEVLSDDEGVDGVHDAGSGGAGVGGVGGACASGAGGADGSGGGMLVDDEDGFLVQAAPPPIQELATRGSLAPRGLCCHVCEIAEQDDENLLLCCSGCYTVVHMLCYGVTAAMLHDLVTQRDGRWLCRPCEAGVEPGRAVCALCPVPFGAFKRTTDLRWVHLACAAWIPEAAFMDTRRMEPIGSVNEYGVTGGMDGIPRSRFGLQCAICGKNEGICLHCASPGCRYTAHPICCRATNPDDASKMPHLALDMDETGSVVNGFTVVMHCPEHLDETMRARVGHSTELRSQYVDGNTDVC